jgi:hypothetical protein
VSCSVHLHYILHFSSLPTTNCLLILGHIFITIILFVSQYTFSPLICVIFSSFITFCYRAEVKGKHLRQIILQLAPELSPSSNQARTLHSRFHSSHLQCNAQVVNLSTASTAISILRKVIKHHLHNILSLTPYLFSPRYQWEDGLDQSAIYDPVNISSGSRSDSLLELLQASEERYMVRTYELVVFYFSVILYQLRKCMSSWRINHITECSTTSHILPTAYYA